MIEGEYPLNEDPIRYYLTTAYEYADAFSDDPSTKTGAVLVPPEGDVFIGYNHAVPGITLTPERLERPQKYHYLMHAEEEAIKLAVLELGAEVFGSWLYAPWAACSRCSRDIITAGITTVITHKDFEELAPKRWEQDVAMSKQMMAECGILVVSWSGFLDTIATIGGTEYLV